MIMILNTDIEHAIQKYRKLAADQGKECQIYM